MSVGLEEERTVQPGCHAIKCRPRQSGMLEHAESQTGKAAQRATRLDILTMLIVGA